MPRIIAIKLLPKDAVAADDFTAYLEDLTITVHDASFLDPAAEEPGAEIGTATYIPPTLPPSPSPDPDPQPDADTRIVQHFGREVVSSPPPLFNRLMFSVATAVIEIPDGVPAVEHETVDLRITIERGGTTIEHKRRYFNVPTRPGGLPGDPNDFPGLTVDGDPFVSLYLNLPPPGLETGGTLIVPEDGTAPSFDLLHSAVTDVLNDDPGNTNDITQLTPAQARHVANEIVWDRAAQPLPVPDARLENMYTGPNDPNSNEERARQLFEGDLTVYRVGNDATAERLANFVYALSSALWIAERVDRADAATLVFPVKPAEPGGTTRVKLTGIATVTPFEVPAAYIYALTAVLPLQVTREQRFDIVVMGNEAQMISTFDEAIHNNIITENATVDRFQGARRLVAIGGAREPGLATCGVVAGEPVQAVVDGWLASTGPEINDFWGVMNAAQTVGHFGLVLCAVTKEHAPLMAAITDSPGISTVDELEDLSDEAWLDLFTNDPSLLPPFTAPGTVVEQTAAFLRSLRRFLAASAALTAPDTIVPGSLPLLEPPADDLISELAERVPGLDLVTFDPAVNGAALDALFPNDPEGRAAFEAWLGCLQAVLSLVVDISPEPLRFSVAEALWARGFIEPSDLDGLDLEAFRQALVGTVAYEHAETIFAVAENAGATPAEPVGDFAPVNPHGALANCLPPKHLSPLGPVAYLKELLQVTEAATCEDPLAGNDNDTSLADALSMRRGPIGDLAASHSNACVPIPLIDIVNESLESIIATGNLVGSIYNTGRDTLGGHVLNTHPNPNSQAVVHSAETMFCALPEHSTPATPTAQQTAWGILVNDFSSCGLPYHQPLDIARTYLSQLGTSRYKTMRAFTREIHDFVLDPDSPPTDFQSHLWRYPVRLPLALDYLCITPEEYNVLYSPGLLGPAALPRHFGIFIRPGEDPNAWMDEVTMLPVFLERTCLNYCQFLELIDSGFVDMSIRRRPSDSSSVIRQDEEDLSHCEPCCLEEFRLVFSDPADPFIALKRLSVFIRLWRRLQTMENTRYSFAELADIANVFSMFNGAVANPDFIRQLAAFQMLRDDFDLLLTDPEDPPNSTASGALRTHLLAFWVPNATKFDWALDHLLYQIQQYAIDTYHCPCRPPEFLKILRENIDPLSRLVGFDPDSPGREWHARPTHTLRMAEILAKIYASRFGVGEIFFIFTADPQLQGGDPYPAQTENEARDLPFDIPDNETENSLFALRDKLLAISMDSESTAGWTWMRMGETLQETYGLPENDPRWLALGTHFFPDVLEAEGETVVSTDRVWREPLAIGATSAAMWNTPEGPFRYITSTGELETSLPITDEAVLAKLARIRQLTALERFAVTNLYMAPRELLAFFAFLFENQREAERKLIEEGDSAQRWAWFQSTFVRFHARSQAIARHVAAHIDRITGDEKYDGTETALLLMRHLWADENTAVTPWEDDTGAVPNVSWRPRPNGGAFHALNSVVGTGMIAEYRGASPLMRWRETRGGIDAFGDAENAVNAPLPTLIPAMDTTLTTEQLDYVAIRNGFALGNKGGMPVGGAEPFTLVWRGLLLIETAGTYGFSAGAPRPDAELPDFEILRRFHRWRVRLKQGQRSWILLAHDWPDEEAPAACAEPIYLERGFYDFTIEFERLPLVLDGPEDVCPQVTGFQVKYDGPDAGGTWQAIPHDKLFIATGERLEDRIDTGVTAPGSFEVLSTRHVVSVRSMRRTMQRLIKAMLFADRLNLGATPMADSGQSELGYMLSQPERFVGQSYFDGGGGLFLPHRANFDFNLLPVDDNYFPPGSADDQRVAPSPQRISALFDWWERGFDYSVMRTATERSPEQPVWLLFHEAAEAHEDETAQLLRHVDVNIRHVPLVLRYYDPSNVPSFIEVTSANLEDDRWTIRVWHADLWVQALREAFLEADIGMAEPYLWASEGPEMNGLVNLTQFYRDGCIENEEPRRYKEIESLNDELRLRGRDALVAYLTAMNRVLLPWGGFARTARDLSELLLLDVEAGLCQKAARVEEAISAVQLFVDRARLGLETGFSPGSEFAHAWDRRFSDFRRWEVCKRHEIYRENWVDWREETVASGSEAFRFLQSELRRNDLTLPTPGGGVHWPAADLPPQRALTLLQAREPATMARLEPPRQGLGLLGTPDRHPRPSWLSPIPSSESVAESSSDVVTGPERPMWFEAAVRLGTKFLRVVAATTPPASSGYVAKCGAPEAAYCCKDCGRDHPAVMDEYYFWIDVSEEFLPVEQVSEWVPGAALEDDAELPLDGTGAPILNTVWHDPEALPGALAWAPRLIARLNWCRVHNGEFQVPRRSTEGVLLLESLGPGLPDITFNGRVADSLFFEIEGAESRDGYPEDPRPGFRYDIAPDDAVTLPELVPAVIPDIPGSLSAFPWFAWFCPGKPILPQKTFGMVIAVAEQLAVNCRYEDALKWLELEWVPLHGDNIWADCDRMGVPETTVPEQPEPDTGIPPVEPVLIFPPRPQRPGECCCPSNSVSDIRVERRYVMMRYGEIMLDWTDALMRKGTPEAFQRARLLADTIYRVLGAVPKTVVEKAGDEMPSSVSEVELACAPLNPRLMCLYTRMQDRRDLIHACLNAHRLKIGKANIERPYFADSRIRECWQIADEICLEEGHWCRRYSPYRFSVLVERAQRVATECRSIGGQLLAAFEKGDGEYLSQLRVKHEKQINDLTLNIRQDQWREADWSVQVLRKAKESALTNLTYYQNLVDAGLLSGEAQHEPLTGTSTGLRAAGNVVEAIGQAMNLIPDPNVGFPTNFTTLPPGKKLAMIFSSAGTVVNVASDIVNTVSSLGLTKDGWERREDEWQHQIDIFTIEVDRIEREILAAERRRNAALRELNVHRQTIENSVETQDFLRDKFTSHELCLWLQKETAVLYTRCYELALQCAWDAERAFNFERELSADRFIALDPADSLHERLLEGERLELALMKMQKAYEDRDRRPYELIKHISLRHHFPQALLQLISTGRCYVELPEWLFDLDYPGQYLRRIRSLSFSLPCVVGPYTGIHCKVTLMKSSIRVSPELLEPDYRCCDDKRCNTGYEPLPEDPRIVNLFGATEAIATSTGQNDSGLFELSSSDPRYFPFEYQGAICRLCIELPHETNHFDIESLTDFIIHMRYMAHEGGDLLRAAAAKCASAHLPGSGTRFIDAKRELLGYWRRMAAPARHGIRSNMESEFLGLFLRRELFPFLTGNRRPMVTKIEILFEAPGADPSRHYDVIFFAGERVETIVPDTCRENVFTIDCVSDAAWPGFFHGVLSINPVILTGDEGMSVGVLSFDPEIKKLCNVWLLLGYEVTEQEPNCIVPVVEKKNCLK